MAAAASGAGDKVREEGILLPESTPAADPGRPTRRFKVARRFALLTPVALASMVLAVWYANDETMPKQWLPNALQGLWLTRDVKGINEPENVADCVFDASFAGANMMAFGLAITGVAGSCPAAAKADEASKQLYLDAAKEAHQARMTAVFGAPKPEEEEPEKGPMHHIAKHTLDKIDELLKQYNISGIPKIPEPKKKTYTVKDHLQDSFKETVDHTKEAVTDYHGSTYWAKVAEADRRTCAADVTDVLSRISYVTASISHMTAECDLVFNQKAYCAGDISRLLAGVTQMASAAAGISAQCTKYADYIHPAGEGPVAERRLSGQHSSPVKKMFESVTKAKKQRQQKIKSRHIDIANCIDASWFAATFFARFLDMTPAIKHCTPLRPNEACGAAIIDIFASLAWTSTAISYAVAKCPVKGTNNNAACSAVISKFLAAIADTASALTVVVPTCLNKNVFDQTR